MGVVGQFPRLEEPGVVRLRRVLGTGSAMTLEQIAATVRQGDQRGAVASDDERTRLDEAGFSKASEFTVSRVCGTSALVVEIGCHHDAERAGRRQNPNF